LLCQAATHGRTQLHAVAERLSISFGDNDWVCSPVSETPWLEPAVEAMCLWQTFVSGQCVRNAMIVANIPLVSPSLERTTLAFDLGDRHHRQSSSYIYIYMGARVCVCVCVCVCLCVCVCVYVWVCLCACVQLCKHAVAACQHRENVTPLWFLCLSALAEGKK